MRRSAAALLISSLIRAARAARSAAVVAAVSLHIGDLGALCGIELWGCALAIERSLLLLDEPRGHWMQKLAKPAHLAARLAMSLTSIFVIHGESEAMKIAHRVACYVGLNRAGRRPPTSCTRNPLTSASGHEFLGGSLYAWEAGVEMIRKVRLPRPRRLHQHSQVQTDGLATRNAA